MSISNKQWDQEPALTDVAIIGMAGRFPGANHIDQFWKNMVNGLESIKQFSKEELRAAGENEALLNNAQYVRAKGIVDDIEWFDASFFGFNAQDARITDPQQRLFLECSWEALESAGYAPEKFDGLIGVYASMADSSYLQHNLLKNNTFIQSLDWLQTRMATSIATLSTQVSYRLNLKGPSVNVATACSSSLVAIATACRSLIDYDCDMAIAGASTIAVPQTRGYLFQEGGIESPDGHCRVFDIHSKGTVFSNGVGIVILKRLQEAIRDGDTIYSVIKGWNVNNDGADKAGFVAPSVNGQAQCMAGALALANIEADSISYIETHGTGTTVGDPIELRAMTNAFSMTTDKKMFCAIGSVKTNIGHTDIAAGMPSVIKVALALKNKVIPPTLHYTQQNPAINFADTPFYLNTQLQNWDFGHLPRRAGINGSGIGGTNAFLILEEYNQLPQKNLSRPYQLFFLSAKTKTSLQQITKNLQSYLTMINSLEELANAAFTLHVGRADFNYRQFFICKDTQEAITLLNESPADQMFMHHQQSNNPAKVTFMLTGQGSQYVGMATELYQGEPEFAKWIDICCDHLDHDLQQAVHALILGTNKKNTHLHSTAIVQPALFIVEYALANLLIHFGIQPAAMIGHSIGEYVAACLAGVMDLTDALELVCRRGHLMAKTAAGAMLAIPLSENELGSSLPQDVSLAAINSPDSCVISGTEQAIATLEKKYQQQGIVTRRLNTSHAFHSHLMEPVLSDFRAAFDHIHLKKPTIPFISNVTGTWITVQEATNPDYWVNHLRQTVQFLQGLETLIKEQYTIFLEVGPGKTLTNFTLALIKKNAAFCIQNSLPRAKDAIPAQACFLQALGQLWLYGLKINWQTFYSHEKRQRVALPTYPFDRQYYWVTADPQIENVSSKEKKPYPQWFYEPSWTKTSFQCEAIHENHFSIPHCWIILLDNQGVGAAIGDILTQYNQLVILVKPGQQFTRLQDTHYEINFHEKADYISLITAINQVTSLPFCLINLLPLTEEHDMTNLNIAEVENTMTSSFYSTLFFTQAITEQQYNKPTNILIAGNEIYSVLGDEKIYPAKATAIGPCRVIQQEQPLFKIKIVDLILDDLVSEKSRTALCHQLILDTLQIPHAYKENNIAYRKQFRWIQDFRPVTLLQTTSQPLRLRENGVYLFTGGLGGISLTLAEKIALTVKKAHFILLFRSDFPKQSEWQHWLTNHPATDPTSKKIQQLLKIIQLGAEIVLYQVDITHLSQLETTIQKMKQKFPILHGVIHAAGIAGGGLAQLKTADMANKVLAPKVIGTYLLMHLLQHESLDFVMLCSSISSALGLVSQVDYCAANACLDAFSQSLYFNKKNTLCVAISWNTWRDVGMAFETDSPTDMRLSSQYNSISPAEGATIFIDALSHPYNHLVISTIDLNAAIHINNDHNTTHSSHVLTRNDTVSEERDTYIPPQNNMEMTLAEIWQEILGISKIGMLDDFFLLGGHSLAALKMLNKLENKIGIRLSLQSLQEAKTIRKLAAIVTPALPKNTTNHSSVIVPIRSDGHYPPLFLMHPVGGNVFCYLPLAKHLTFDCPIYGLQDPSSDHGKMIYTSLEEMATYYLQAIQQIQPKGPYLLGGLSFGATLSVEIAKQLYQQGEQVRPLLLFDGWAKFSEEQHIKKVFIEAMLHSSNSIACDEHFAHMSWERMLLLLNYSVPTIHQKLILFKAAELLPEYKRINNAYNHWVQFSNKKNIELYITPGNHETILAEPHVMTLANTLNAVLPRIVEHEPFLTTET